MIPASKTSLSGKAPRRLKILMILIILVTALSLSFAAAGCGSTFPKEKLEQSIIRICKNEYKVDVKVQTTGKTIAIYLPLSNLLDFTFSITKDASEKINDVILSVSRVALSTDANFDFYCVIAHDVRIPEIQIVIIKSVDDVKRFLLNDISRDEYSRRMLVDLSLNPQAQKESAIKQVFEKMNLDKKWQDEVMNDFFRSEPTVLGDIGYWNGRFYIKDISLPEFIVDQIISRMKISFREDKDLYEAFTLKSAKGSYISRAGKSSFRVEVSTEPKWFKEFNKKELEKRIFEIIVKASAGVIHAYRFENFDYVDVVNVSGAERLLVPKNILENFRKKKVKFGEIYADLSAAI